MTIFIFDYIREYTTTTNISVIHENICFHYTRRMYNENKHLLLLYETMYHRNICCHYMREYMMTTNISVINESVFLIIQDDV